MDHAKDCKEVQQLCIFDIKRFALHDGPGIRTSVFLKGCRLSCGWCHNPEGISPDIEAYTETICFDGKSWQEKHEAGRWIADEILMEELLQDRVFMDVSGGGITFTGGEPLYQHEALFRLLSRCRDEGIHAAVDTSGYAHASVMRELSDRCDLVLYDLKCLDAQRHRTQTGVSNALILKNLGMLLQRSAPVIIRIPLITGFNATREEGNRICHYLSALKKPLEVHLLPYHPYGKHKHERFHQQGRINGFSTPDPAMIGYWRDLFSVGGFTVRTGG